jgi:hypothetical protein
MAAGIDAGKTDALMTTVHAWTQPQGHTDIAPTRYGRIEGDGYLTLDASWIVPALLQKVPEIDRRILEPSAGRGHLSLESRRAGLEVVSIDPRRYVNPLVDDIGQDAHLINKSIYYARCGR